MKNDMNLIRKRPFDDIVKGLFSCYNLYKETTKYPLADCGKSRAIEASR